MNHKLSIAHVALTYMVEESSFELCALKIFVIEIEEWKVAVILGLSTIFLSFITYLCSFQFSSHSFLNRICKSIRISNF